MVRQVKQGQRVVHLLSNLGTRATYMMDYVIVISLIMETMYKCMHGIKNI